MEGIALTTLRPAGSAEFNGQKYDVVADWEYIPKGNKIKVIRVEGIKVVVKGIERVKPDYSKLLYSLIPLIFYSSFNI